MTENVASFFHVRRSPLHGVVCIPFYFDDRSCRVLVLGLAANPSGSIPRNRQLTIPGPSLFIQHNKPFGL